MMILLQLYIWRVRFYIWQMKRSLRKIIQWEERVIVLLSDLETKILTPEGEAYEPIYDKLVATLKIMQERRRKLESAAVGMQLTLNLFLESRRNA